MPVEEVQCFCLSVICVAACLRRSGQKVRNNCSEKTLNGHSQFSWRRFIITHSKGLRCVYYVILKTWHHTFFARSRVQQRTHHHCFHIPSTSSRLLLHIARTFIMVSTHTASHLSLVLITSLYFITQSQPESSVAPPRESYDERAASPLPRDYAEDKYSTRPPPARYDDELRDDSYSAKGGDTYRSDRPAL